MELVLSQYSDWIFSQQAQRLYCTSTEKYVHSELKNGIRKITMVHQKTRNSLSNAMMQTLIKEINDDKDNPELRVIVLAAEGPVFSAGHNLKEFTPETGRASHTKIFKTCTDLMNSILDCPVPIIARVDGIAAAAGCQLAAQCDMIYCSKESKFSTPGATFGIFCSTPGIALARCVPKMTAMKMLLTGKHITADEARSSGLVSEVCSKESLDSEIEAACDAIKSKSRAVIELGKRFYYKQIHMDVRKAYDVGGDVMVDNINTTDGVEGVKSFVEKRKANWKHK